ncbi:hypothetical protein [Streptomyces sp. NPDC000878]
MKDGNAFHVMRHQEQADRSPDDQSVTASLSRQSQKTKRTADARLNQPGIAGQPYFGILFPQVSDVVEFRR